MNVFQRLVLRRGIVLACTVISERRNHRRALTDDEREYLLAHESMRDASVQPPPLFDRCLESHVARFKLASDRDDSRTIRTLLRGDHEAPTCMDARVLVRLLHVEPADLVCCDEIDAVIDRRLNGDGRASA